MSTIIIDASVAIKWFVPEVHSNEAAQWQNSSHDLHVPGSLFDLEIGNILWKKVNRSEITRADADLILAQLTALPLIRHPEGPLLTSAFDLAVRNQRTVYDSIYLAIAVEQQGRMVTADLRLHNALTATSFSSFICWVADFSAVP